MQRGYGHVPPYPTMRWEPTGGSKVREAGPGYRLKVGFMCAQVKRDCPACMSASGEEGDITANRLFSVRLRAD